MPAVRTRAVAKRRQRWLRVAAAAFYVVLVAMLVSVARTLDVEEIVRSVRALPPTSMVLAAACSMACYIVYACYEVLAARIRELGVPVHRVALIGFASYACNLSLGSIVGALGVRLKLYAREGIPAAEALTIVALNLMTNWSGYLVVLGGVLVAHVSTLPAAWSPGGSLLRGLGIVFVLAALGYACACAFARRRTWTVRGQDFELPALRVAVMQLALSVPVWLLTSASLAVLLGDVAFDLVVIALLASAMIGLVIRVPAGLGVLEGVFVASFGNELGHARVLGALVAFRCIHYLAPLVAGLAVFGALQWRARRLAAA